MIGSFQKLLSLINQRYTTLIAYFKKDNDMYNVPPVLFIIFNRKDVALKALRSIRDAKPKLLFVACDGARNEHEEKVVQETRSEILNAIDWDCDVNTLFQKRNLGCGKGVHTAISWFFSNVEYGIILEDDCVADISFFRYAAAMLSLYKDDYRVGMIAGYNPIKLWDYPYSYLFSRYKSCWGWATWRRAWENMDLDMQWRNNVFKDSVLANSGFHNLDASKWRFQLRCIDNDIVSAWDWQWYFSLAAQNQLCVYPKCNLISNIGNGEDATHTSLSNITIESTPLSFPLVSPLNIVPYEYFDRLFYKSNMTVRARLSRIIPTKMKRRIKKLLKYFQNVKD